MQSNHLFGRISGFFILAGLTFPAAGEPDIEETFRILMGNARVQKAIALIREDDERTLREQIEISEIAAPPFKESRRAEDYERRLRESGLTDVRIDAEGNVIGRRKGVRARPRLVVSAHLDTVFPEGTDVTVRQEGGRYFGKGLSDDARGLATNLSVLRALENAGIQTRGEILFIGTVGEEGLGNLRGVKALFRGAVDIDGFISVDGVSPPEDSNKPRHAISTQATGSRRWSFRFTGPGGHSFNNFGLPSAIHAMGRAIARIAELRTSPNPKTTFTVGVVSGGWAVNAIAPEAQMQVDIRSNDPGAMEELEGRIMAAVQAAVVDENERWDSADIHVTPELIGDRPAGNASNGAAIVRAAVQAYAALGQPQPELNAASTDSNVPIGLGIPAITLDAGGIGAKYHSPDEWYEPVEAWLGPQQIMLTTLALVGVDGLSSPVLSVRRPEE